LNLDGFHFRNITEACCAVKCGGTGPNDFNFYFIKGNLDILGKDFIKVINCFHESGYILKGFNALFVIVIPEKDNTTTLNDYSPILFEWQGLSGQHIHR